MERLRTPCPRCAGSGRLPQAGGHSRLCPRCAGSGLVGVEPELAGLGLRLPATIEEAYAVLRDLVAQLEQYRELLDAAELRALGQARLPEEVTVVAEGTVRGVRYQVLTDGVCCTWDVWDADGRYVAGSQPAPISPEQAEREAAAAAATIALRSGDLEL